MPNTSQAAHQYNALREALQQHGHIIIHRAAITGLPGLEAVAQNIARTVPGAKLIRSGDIQTGEQWLELTC